MIGYLDPCGVGGCAQSELTPSARLGTNPELRILLAEGDAETRRQMTVALRTEGHDVLEVSDGLGLLYQALFGWRDVFDKPDVIVSEMRLAGGWNGFDMMDWLRGAAVETPYVFLTESGDATGCSEALRRGAGVLTKPIDLGGLCEMVRRETTR